MKKLLILFFLTFILISCEERYNIEQTTYIDSIALDYQDNKYIVYFHITATNSLIRNNNSNINYSIGVSEGNNLYEAFDNISKSITGNVNLTHIQSFIFSSDFATLDNLKYFVTIVKTYDFLTPNFYCYVTESNLKEILSLENPENVSPFFSILNSSDFISNNKLTYFTELAKSIYEDYYITKINMIAINYIWENQNKKIISVIQTGNLYLNKEGLVLKLNADEFKAISILNNEQTTTIILNEKIYNIYNQKISVIYKENIFILKIRGNLYISNLNSANYLYSIETFEKSIQDEFEKLLEVSKIDNFDFLNLENILYRKNKLKNGFDYKTAELQYDIKYSLLN